MPWQWGKGSCITPCSRVERQMCFIMWHNGVRSFRAGQIYPTPASWQPCPQDRISKSTSNCAAFIFHTEKWILIPVSSVTLWISAGSGLFSCSFFWISSEQCISSACERLKGFSAVLVTGSLSLSTLNVSYRFMWLQLPHWSTEYIFVTPLSTRHIIIMMHWRKIERFSDLLNPTQSGHPVSLESQAASYPLTHPLLLDQPTKNKC